MVSEVTEETERPGSDIQTPGPNKPASIQDSAPPTPPEITKNPRCQPRPPEDVLGPASGHSVALDIADAIQGDLPFSGTSDSIAHPIQGMVTLINVSQSFSAHSQPVLTCTQRSDGTVVSLWVPRSSGSSKRPRFPTSIVGGIASCVSAHPVRMSEHSRALG